MDSLASYLAGDGDVCFWLLKDLDFAIQRIQSLLSWKYFGSSDDERRKIQKENRKNAHFSCLHYYI